MAAVGELQAHQRVARLQQGVVDGRVGLSAGVGLDVGVFGPEQRFRPVDRQLLGHVDVLATPVVALAGVAFGVLVVEYRALALEHRQRAKFSEAIISSVRCWRSSSADSTSAISGSTSASGREKKSGGSSALKAPRILTPPPALSPGPPPRAPPATPGPGSPPSPAGPLSPPPDPRGPTPRAHQTRPASAT